MNMRHVLAHRTATVILTSLIVAEVTALAYLQSPTSRFVRFIAFDSGVDLTMQNLMSRGYRPAIDFGCVYGLVPLLVNRIWYWLAGLTPTAFRIEGLLALYVFAWALARFALTTRLGLVGIAMIMLAMPDVLFPSSITIVQVIEPTLLVLAITEHAKGRRGTALSLATASCFVKPAMGYVYGAWMLVCLVSASRGKPREDWLRPLLSAAAVGIVLAVTLIATFGIVPLLATILPIRGAAAYRAYGVGFFNGIGRGLLEWPRGGLLGYFRYEVGFWMLGSLVLLLGALNASARLIRN